jgi:ankyrin repeat protein
MEPTSYWKGLYCLNYRKEDFTKTKKSEEILLISQVALKLLDGLTAGRLEKLQGCGSYSVRVNIKGRMKFSTIKVKDIPYLLFLEYLPNHEYDQSKFNDYNTVQKAKNRDYSDEPITREILSGIEVPKKVDIEEVTHYRGQDIVLSMKQTEILKHPMPMMVLGQPGSGKTCVASQLILHFAASREQKSVLYLTKSSYLAKQMQESYDTSPERPSESKAQVSFFDYESFIRTYDSKDIKFATKTDFTNWFSTQKTRIPAENLYQEFPLIHHCQTFKNYEKLGKKQCLIHDQKKEASDLKENYIRYLAGKQLVDVRLYTPKTKLPEFDFMVIDEAQGFSPVQIDILSKLSKNNQHAVLLDSKQDQASSLPVRQQTADILNKRAEVVQIELTENYRNAPAVLNVANALLNLGNQAIGGELDDKAYTEMQPASNDNKKGYAGWVELQEVEKKLKQCEESIEWAIVCPQALKAEVRKQLNTPLIFSFEEVQGLQYPNVIVWGVPDMKIFKEINDVLPDSKASGTTKKNNPKDHNRARFAPSINALHVAFTRAEQKLYFVQNSGYKPLSKVYDRLKSNMDVSRSTVEKVSKTSAEDWKKEAAKLDDMGHSEQAESIRQRFTNGSKKKKKKKKDVKKSVPEKAQDKNVNTYKVYVEGAAKNIPGNIHVILNHKSCNRILYEEKLPNRQTLFDFISQDHDIISQLAQAHKIVEILNSINGPIFLKNLIEKDDSSHRTLVSTAIELGHAEILNYYHRDLGADLKTPIKKGPKEGLCPVHLAALSDDVKILEYLDMKGIDLNTSIEFGTCLGLTPAALASEYGKEKVLEYLHQRGIDITTPLKEGVYKDYAPIFLAARAGKVNILKFFASLGFELNAPVADGMYQGNTVIYGAASCNRVEVLKFFKEKGFDLNVPNQFGHCVGLPPWGGAVRSGRVEALEYFHNIGVDFNTPISSGSFKGLTAIELAKLSKQENVLQLLLRYKMKELNSIVNVHGDLFEGMDMNFPANILTILNHENCDKFLYELKLPSGKTLFDVFSSYKIIFQLDDNTVVEILRNKNGHELLKKLIGNDETKGLINTLFSLHSINRSYWNAVVTKACESKDIEFMKGYCIIGRGGTLAGFAASQGRVNILETLNELEVDLFEEFNNMTGETPVTTAVRYGKLEVIQYFHELGYDLRTAEKSGKFEGCYPVHFAAHHGHCHILKFLDSLGIDLNSMVECGKFQGCTPVYLASNSGKVEVLKFLKEKGFDLNAPISEGPRKGLRPWHFTIKNGHVEALEFFLNNGVVLNTPVSCGEYEGFTAIELAKAYKKDDVLQLLLDYQTRELNAFVDELCNDYEGVGKNFPSNILTILNHKSCDEILYEKKSPSGITLFDYILQNHQIIFKLDKNLIVEIVRNKKAHELFEKLVEKHDTLSFITEMEVLYINDRKCWDEVILKAFNEYDVEFIKGYCILGIGGALAAHAASQGRVEVLRLLKTFGVDLTQEADKPYKMSPVYIATKDDQVEVLKYYHDELEFDLKTALKDGPCEGFAPIHIAAFYGCVNVMEYLDKIGIDLNTPITQGTEKGCTPLILATAENKVEVLTFLKFKRCDLNFTITEGVAKGLRAWYFAIEKDCAEALVFLYFNDADLKTPISSSCHKGLTPIAFAKQLNRVKILETLKKLGLG